MSTVPGTVSDQCLDSKVLPGPWLDFLLLFLVPLRIVLNSCHRRFLGLFSEQLSAPSTLSTSFLSTPPFNSRSVEPAASPPGPGLLLDGRPSLVLHWSLHYGYWRQWTPVVCLDRQAIKQTTVHRSHYQSVLIDQQHWYHRGAFRNAESSATESESAS